jgi:hypothetical protein
LRADDAPEGTVPNDVFRRCEKMSDVSMCATSRTERIERQFAQMIGIAHRDVHEIVIRAGDVKDTAHFGQRRKMSLERSDRSARVLLQPNRDQRFERHAIRPRIDLGVIAE